MKKIVILFTLLILFTGCEVEKISQNDLSKIVEETLSYKKQGSNNYFNGYEYYMPRGFRLRDRKGNNHVLVSNGENYYLYVDVVSYFHRKEIETTFDKELYFSEKISYNNISGYVKVSAPKNDIYYIEIVYNYSKIEAYVAEENIKSAIRNSLKILSSIKYNDVILDTLIGEKTLDYKEEVYDFFESKREDENFLDYIEEYGTYEKEEVIKDDDVLDLEDLDE